VWREGVSPLRGVPAGDECCLEEPYPEEVEILHAQSWDFGFAGVPAFWLFAPVLAETQTRTMYPKQGADHERSSALQYSDLLGRLEEQIAAD
jgi:hypothetical protein